MTEDQALLSEIGRALYGARWQSAVAEDLGVSDRTVRRWIAGESAVPIGVWGEFRGSLVERNKAIVILLSRL